MKNFKTLCTASALLVLTTITPAQAQVSATSTTTIDVNFPEILILYTYSDVTLDLDATFLAGETDFGAGSTTCGTGGSCVDEGTGGTVTVDAASKDLDIASTVAAATDTTVDFELTNAFGARSLGLTDANYTVSITEVGNSTVVNLGTGVPTTLSNTGLTLSTGDLPLTLDLSALSATSASESEDITITVSGT